MPIDETIGRSLGYQSLEENLCILGVPLIQAGAEPEGYKLSILARLSNFMCTNKKRVLMKAFIESQFGYCLLIWMFRSRGVNNKINHLHKRSLEIVYKDNISSFEDLLKRDKEFTIHQRNIQSLALELFKVKRNL